MVDFEGYAHTVCSIVLSAGFVVVANDLSMILRDNFLQVLWKLKFVSISA